MPVFKYKTFSEAEKALWNFNPDEKYYETARDLWEIADQFSTRQCSGGIFKFKTFEEANKHRYEEEIREAKILRQKRNHSPENND